LWPRRADAFPRLANGKVDASRLPQPSVSPSSGKVTKPQNETESKLVEIWQDTIGLESVGVDQDFFSIGGDSLSSIQLISKINSTFNKRLSPIQLIEAPTIRRLAELLVDGAAVVKSKILIRFNDFSKGVPLICVHAGNLDALYFRFLANHFSDRPVIALQSRGLDGEEEPLSSIAEIAEDYLNEISKVEGLPFESGSFSCDLVGYCMGTPVALEMAKLLEDRGSPARSLTIVDSAVKWPKRENTVARVRQEYKSVTAWLPRYLIRFIVPFWYKSKQAVWKWKMQNSSDPEEVAHFLRWTVREKVVEGHFAHESSEIQTPILLVRSTESAADPQKRCHLEVERYATGGFSIALVEGEHDSTLLEPMVEHVAKEIRNYIEKAGVRDTPIFSS